MPRKNNSPVQFHGAFSDRKKAEERAARVNGKVEEIRVNGHPRFTVYTKRKG